MTKFTRRRVVVSGLSVGLTALSGCTFFGKPDLRVYNATSETESYSVEVINQDTEEVTLSRTDTVQPNQSTTYQECFKKHNVSHQVTLDVENGPSATTEWSQPNEPTALGADVEPSKITFQDVHQDSF